MVVRKNTKSHGNGIFYWLLFISKWRFQSKASPNLAEVCPTALAEIGLRYWPSQAKAFIIGLVSVQDVEHKQLQEKKKSWHIYLKTLTS